VTSQDNDNEAIRAGQAPLARESSGLASARDLEPNANPTSVRSGPWFRIGATLVVLPLAGSCLGAPFLIPFFQLYLIPPILGAMALGAIGGAYRKWWVTGFIWYGLLAVYVWHDHQTNPFGYKSLYRTYVLDDPPEGFMYFHSWEQLYQITIVPLTLGVATLAYGWVVTCPRHRDAANAAALSSKTMPPMTNEEN
jgi:hypothetical protein